MSRKGNKALDIPAGVTVTVSQNNVNVAGPKGKLDIPFPHVIHVKVENNKVRVTRDNEEKQTKMYHGTINSLIHNAIIGVTDGYTKKLHIEGVGYKASVSGNKFNLAIGFSHPVVLQIPENIKVVCKTPTDVEITGFDKIVVGEFAANIREIRKPEPYNGKGIMYVGEHIIRKVGKTAEGTKK